LELWGLAQEELAKRDKFNNALVSYVDGQSLRLPSEIVTMAPTPLTLSSQDFLRVKTQLSAHPWIQEFITKPTGEEIYRCLKEEKVIVIRNYSKLVGLDNSIFSFNKAAAEGFCK
jgi:hypothetical protein